MPRIKELQTYTGPLNKGDIFIAVDGQNFPRGRKMSGQQVYTMCKGVDGRNIQLRTSGAFVQWTQEGTSVWSNLIALSDLKGADGKDVEMRAHGGYIQYRLVGGSWANLVALSDLRGDKGDPAPSPAFTFAARSINPGDEPTANVTGVYPNLHIEFGIPKGKDAELPVFSFQITALEHGTPPTAEIEGVYPNLTVKLGLPKGKNAEEPAFAVSAEKVAASEQPTIEKTGDYPNLNLRFKIPAGERGLQGKPLVVLSNGNYGNWNEATRQYDDSGVSASASVDLSNMPVDFTEASDPDPLQTGETLPILLGKIKKWLSSLKALAFKDKVDYNTDIDNKPALPSKLSQLQNDNNTVQDANYVHTDNNYTANEKQKLQGIEEYAQANNISSENASALTSGGITSIHKHAAEDIVVNASSFSKVLSAEDDNVQKLAKKVDGIKELKNDSVDYDSLSQQFKQRRPLSGNSIDFYEAGIYDIEATSDVAFTFTNLVVNKTVTLLLTVKNSANITFPPEAVIPQGSPDLSGRNGLYEVNMHCLAMSGSNAVTVYIAQLS